MRMLAGVVFLGAGLIAGCGPGSSGGSSTSTTSPPVATLSINVIADPVGLGCFQTPIDAQSRLVVEDGDGKTLGVSDFAKASTAGACHWRTTVERLPATASFYHLVVDGDDLQTVSKGELEDAGWHLRLHVGVDGRVDVR